MSSYYSGILAAALLFSCSAAAQMANQSGVIAPAQPSKQLRLPENASCGQMKQSLLSVRGNPAPTPDADSSGLNPNISGITARTTMARQEIVKGDSACEKGDTATARIHYQKAVDEITSPN